MADVVGQRGLAHRHRQVRALQRQGGGAGELRLPGQAVDHRLQVLLVHPQADAGDALGGQDRLDAVDPAGIADEEVVGGVVAVADGAHQEVVEGGGEGRLHQGLDRLGEDAEVLALDGQALAEVDQAAIDLVEQSHRHPDLGDALLREGAVALPGRQPAVAHVEHGHAHVAGEAAGKPLQVGLEGGRGRLGRRHGRRGVGDLPRRLGGGGRGGALRRRRRLVEPDGDACGGDHQAGDSQGELGSGTGHDPLNAQASRSPHA